MIGYYVHHVGRGHLERAQCIARHLRTPVTGLSCAERPARWPGDWIQLNRDDYGTCHEVHANGVFHWAPRNHPGLRDRMAQIADWIARVHPNVIVCDVSVEVATFSRLMGVPVIVVALAGDRRDAPHITGYRLASAIIAPWTAGLAPATWSRRWETKTHYVGAFSRFDERAREKPAGIDGAAADEQTAERKPVTDADGGRKVLAIFGTGGSDFSDAQLRAATRANPQYSWQCIGPEGRWVEDPWAQISRADVVVTHAGDGCLAAVAAASRPAVVIPQRRPFGEQVATAHALQDARIAHVEWSWPKASRWGPVLDAACRLGGRRWAEWCPGDGAARAAGVIERIAGGYE